MTLPKIWKDKEQEPEYFVKFNPGQLDAVTICDKKGVTASLLIRRDGIRYTFNSIKAAKNAGVILDEGSRWDKDQCIETLVHYIQENMK